MVFYVRMKWYMCDLVLWGVWYCFLLGVYYMLHSGLFICFLYIKFCRTDENDMIDEMFIFCLGYGYVCENKLIHVWFCCKKVLIQFFSCEWISLSMYYIGFIPPIFVSHYFVDIFISAYGEYINECLINWCGCSFMWFIKVFVSNKNDVFGLTVFWFFLINLD